MAQAATRRSTQQQTTKSAPQGTVQALRFVASAHEHREPIIQQSVVPTTTTQQAVPSNIPIPSYGFLSHVLLDVQWSGGTGGTLAADAPWNFFQSLSIQDVNGAYLQNPIDGYALLQENIYGGYGFRQDPRLSPQYAAATTEGRFLIRIPVQVTRHNAYGSLANQNAAAPYQLSYTLNTIANIWSVAPGVVPTFTIKAFLESWSQPNSRDLRGRPQAQLPPLHGSTQQWSQYTKPVVVGNNVIQLPRVGNTIRTIVVIARDGSGVRSDSVLQDPFTLNLDSRVLTSESVAVRKHLMGESLVPSATVDTGVLAFYFNNSIQGRIGDESSDLWLPTVQSTRLEYDGTAASAGNYQILTNDIAQVEVDQASRYVMESATGDLTHPDAIAR